MSDSEQKLDDRQRRRLAQMPVTMRGAYKRALSKLSRAAAIRAQCHECTGYDRSAVRACPDTGCPLHAYRPHQKSAKGGDE